MRIHRHLFSATKRPLRQLGYLVSPLEQKRTENRPTIDAEQEVRAPLSERVRSLRLPEEPSGRSPSTGLLPWGLCVLLAIATALLGYKAFRPSPETSQGPAEQSGSMAPAGQDSGAVTPPTGEEIALESKGYIIPAHQILISPKITGMIVKLHVLEG